MWLAHHDAEQLDRCVVVGGRHVCRRCLVLYPLAFVALAIALGGSGRWVNESAWSAALWLLPLPAALDWAGEVAGRWEYSRRRQLACTVVAAPALGVGLARWVRSPGDLTVMVPFAVIGLACVVVWIAATMRRELGVEADWQERFERSEQARRARLSALVGLDVDDSGGDQLGTVTKSMSASTAPTSDGSRSL